MRGLLEKSKRVAMVVQKPSKSMDVNPILLILAVYGCVIHINKHAKDEENLLRCFQDRPIATERQPDSD